MHGEIGEAVQLTEVSNTQSSYTYRFSSSIPTAFDVIGTSLAANSSATYQAQTTHYYDASSHAGNMTRARDLIQSVTGVSIIETTSAADIEIAGLNVTIFESDSPYQVMAATFPPTHVTSGLRYDIYLASASSIATAGSSYGHIFLHELNHSIGLKDAHKSTMSSNYDNQRFTVMSYHEHLGEQRQVTELQLYDIAGLQSLYGRTELSSGSTEYLSTYFVDSNDDARMLSIWDSTGTDLISASGLPSGALIDLRPGYFSSIGPDTLVDVSTDGGDPAVTNAGRLNISIAFGAYIENATGTEHNDLIIGNLLSNIINGGDGDDIIYGDGTTAVYDPGEADYRQIDHTSIDLTAAPPTDVAELVGNPTLQWDEIYGGDGDDLIFGTVAGDYLFGDEDNDIIRGGEGSDWLVGGGDNDLLDSGPLGEYGDSLEGGGGNDILILRGGQGSMSGGSGGDIFYITPGVGAGGSAWISDSDSSDQLYWNGYQILGGENVMLDLEWSGTPHNHQYQTGTVDTNGFRYSAWGSALVVICPDNSEIIIEDFTSGDLGISFEAPDEYISVSYDYDTDEWFTSGYDLSNICLDNDWQNFEDLAGAATTLSTPGSYIEPTMFL